MLCNSSWASQELLGAMPQEIVYGLWRVVSCMLSCIKTAYQKTAAIQLTVMTGAQQFALCYRARTSPVWEAEAGITQA